MRRPTTRVLPINGWFITQTPRNDSGWDSRKVVFK